MVAFLICNQKYVFFRLPGGLESARPSFFRGAPAPAEMALQLGSAATTPATALDLDQAMGGCLCAPRVASGCG